MNISELFTYRMNIVCSFFLINKNNLAYKWLHKQKIEKYEDKADNLYRFVNEAWL